MSPSKPNKGTTPPPAAGLPCSPSSPGPARKLLRLSHSVQSEEHRGAREGLLFPGRRSSPRPAPLSCPRPDPALVLRHGHKSAPHRSAQKSVRVAVSAQTCTDVMWPGRQACAELSLESPGDWRVNQAPRRARASGSRAQGHISEFASLFGRSLGSWVPTLIPHGRVRAKELFLFLVKLFLFPRM